MSLPAVQNLPSFQATWDFMPRLQPGTLLQRVARVAWDILRGLVVFWLLAQILKPVFRVAVLPAASITSIHKSQVPTRRKNFLRERSILTMTSSDWERSHQTTTVKTPDGAEIDVLVVRQFQKSNPSAQAPCVLVFNPNGMSFSWYPELHPLLQIAEKTQTAANFVFFDYRGVGASEGNFSDERDLMVDGASVLQFAEQRLNPTRVHWAGHSLGGNISLQTRAATNRLETNGSHLSDRAPASIDAFLKARAGFVVGAFLSYLADLAGFRLDAANAFNQVQGSKLATKHPQDSVIQDGSTVADFTQQDHTLTLEGNDENGHMEHISNFPAAVNRIAQLFR